MAESRNLRNRTNYPERYQRCDDAPMYAEYKVRPAESIGLDMSLALPGVDGTIVAARQATEYGRTEYLFDPDLSLHGQPGVTFYIWLRDSWHEFSIKYMSGGFKDAASVWPETS